MGKVGAAIAGSIIGGCVVVGLVIVCFGWGVRVQGQPPHVDPTRADFVDLLLVLVTVLLTAIGLAVTVGALAIGFVALKSLREIKDDAANAAKDAAAQKIEQTIGKELQPNVNNKVNEVLPAALQTALITDGLVLKTLSDMAKRGELDKVLERVAERMQGVGPEPDNEGGVNSADEYGDNA